MNGKIVPWSEGNIHVSTHALHYGSGVFEGIRCYETSRGSAVFRLKEHLERFYASAAVYRLKIPFPMKSLEEATFEVIRRNGFASCYVRPIAYYGSGSLGVHPRQSPVEVALLAWPWKSYLGVGLDQGIRVLVSSWTKFHSTMMPTTAKACGAYINSMLANFEASDKNYDEAILLNAEGFLAEGSGENIFLVKNKTLLTNDEKSSILLGITRDSVIQIARDLGYTVQIQSLRLEDMQSADEAFFTGTAVEVMPIREIDGKPIGEGRRGPVTQKIQETFFDVILGKNPRYKDWLSFVSPAMSQK